MPFLVSALAAAAFARDPLEILVYETELPTTLHPVFARTSADIRAQSAIWEPLFFRGPIDSEFRSRLVTEVEWLDGGRRLTVHLDPRLRWQDGEPLEARDVCFTVEALRDPGTVSPVAERYRAWIAGCAFDERKHTATISFSRVPREARAMLAFPILPAHAFPSTALTPDDPFARHPVGLGTMRGALLEDRVVLEASPYAPEKTEVPRIVLLDGRGVDPAEQVRQVLAGEVDGIVDVPPSLRATVGASETAILKTYETRTWWAVEVDTRVPPLSDPRVRRALRASLDLAALAETVLAVPPEEPYPVVRPISGPFLASSPCCDRGIPAPGRAEPDSTARDLSEAGLVLVEGLWTWAGGPLSLKLGARAALEPQAPGLPEAIAEQWAALGLAVEVVRFDEESWARIAAGEAPPGVDLLLRTHTADLVEAVGDLFGTRGPGAGRENWLGLSDPEVDRLLAAWEAAPTDTAALDACHALHARLAETQPWLFLWSLDTKSAWNDAIRGNVLPWLWYWHALPGWRIERSPTAPPDAPQPSPPARPGRRRGL